MTTANLMGLKIPERMDLLLKEYGQGVIIRAHQVPFAERPAENSSDETYDPDDGKVDNHDAMQWFEVHLLGEKLSAFGLEDEWLGGDEGFDCFIIAGDDRRFYVNVPHDVCSANRKPLHVVSVLVDESNED